MTFTTPIAIAPSTWKINYQQRVLLLGSCFADHIARKMKAYFLPVTVNPTGTLYNPISVARHIGDQAFDVAIVTFGTAWVYVDKKEGIVVDNCQKRPADEFERRRLTTEEIVRLWKPILEKYRDKKFIFTVSPIRHIKDGLHENEVSKGILLQAVDELTDGERVRYFPSYEILMDELRDYRYYAQDMVHPSETAVAYIWERFEETYFGKETEQERNTLHQLWLDMQHRPLHPDSEESKRFEEQVQARYARLKEQYPWVVVS